MSTIVVRRLGSAAYAELGPVFVELARHALEQGRAVTDEAGAIEALGLKPKLVRSDA